MIDNTPDNAQDYELGEGFQLSLWYIDHGPRNDRPRYGYVLLDNGEEIFRGEHFYPSAGRKDACMVGELLFFLTLGDGDTDPEYFNQYTTEQITWRDSARREELNMLAEDWEGYRG